MWQLPSLGPSDLSTMNETEVADSAWHVYQAGGTLSSHARVPNSGVKLSFEHFSSTR